MFRLGFRMALAGGRESWARLAAIAGGVMIGVALLLFAIAGLTVLYGTSQKPCWQCSIVQFREPGADDLSRNNVLLWRYESDYFQGKDIARHDIARRGTVRGSIPGIPHLPAPGEYYASPALARKIASQPHQELADRFPGRMAGEIGRAGLSSPDELVVIIGHDQAELAQASGVLSVSHINDNPRQRDTGPLITALFVMAVGSMLFAVLTLITMSTRLAAARREEKFAALRLAGATPTQVGSFAAIDALLCSLAGALAGMGLFYAVRSALARAISSDFIAFFPQDLTPGVAGSIVVLLGTPALAATAAVLALRRVQISPLGVSQRVTSKPPRARRIIPLLAGLAVIVGVYLRNRHVTAPDLRDDVMPQFLVGFMLVMIGLVIAGPWLTLLATRMLAWRARSAPALLAARRLVDNPRSAFRPVGVMTIVLFISTIFAVVTPLLFVNYPGQAKATDNLFASQYLRYDGKTIPTRKVDMAIADLQAVPGVRVMPTFALETQPTNEGATRVVVRCRDLARIQVFPTCGPGVKTALKDEGFDFEYILNGRGRTPPQPYAITPEALKQLPVQNLLIMTDGQPRHIEQVRTVLARHYDFLRSGMTWGEESTHRSSTLHGVQLLINGFLFVVLFVAGCSLAVAAGGGILERKRPFTLLRVAGMSKFQLARVVLCESAVPLVATVGLTIIAALFVSRMLITGVLEKGTHIVQPGLDYYIVVGGGLGLAVLILVAILPVLEIVTRPTGYRSE